MSTEGNRIRVTLSGGPFDRCIIFASEGAIEAGLRRGKKVHLYEIKGLHGSYIGSRPMSWLDQESVGEAS